MESPYGITLSAVVMYPYFPACLPSSSVGSVETVVVFLLLYPSIGVTSEESIVVDSASGSEP